MSRRLSIDSGFKSETDDEQTPLEPHIETGLNMSANTVVGDNTNIGEVAGAGEDNNNNAQPKSREAANAAIARIFSNVNKHIEDTHPSIDIEVENR
jgi:hypothetical protein